MIICTKKMDYPLGTQCQRSQSQAMVSAEERVSLLCVQALASRGRLDAVLQQMALHPQYLERFLHSQHYILHMDGPLPLPYRHYIAIMAAARHHCDYLVSLHSAQFLQVGGEPLWLQGLEAAPPRLRHLDHINKVLAHRPWLSGRSHIQALLKPGEQCWSLAELVQAVVLLAHCHALCSFVFASGTDPEPSPAPRLPLSSPPGYCSCDDANGNTVPQEVGPQPQSLNSRCGLMCFREKVQRAQGNEDRRGQRLNAPMLPLTDTDEEEEVSCNTEPSCFITDPEFGYQEFACREENHFQVFRVQDYSWEDHGFSLVNRLYSDIGLLLDERFRSVAALSSPWGPDVRRAVWNYIHCMFDIRYDDYDYGEVNQLLERELKLYIKTVACYPDVTRSPQCPRPCALHTPADKIHMNLLIMEARLQAELLYALRAITQHMIS